MMGLRLLTVCLFCISTGLASEETETTDDETFKPGTFERPDLDFEGAHFVELFEETSVLDNVWVRSKARKDNLEESLAKYDGEWLVGTPSKIVLDGDMGLIVKSRARHHAVAAVLPKPVKFDSDQLIVQYEVKYEDGQECGGGYVKLLSEGAEKNVAQFNDRTDYTVMFGPDKCGATSKVHFILKLENPHNKTVSEHHAPQAKAIPDFTDGRTHLYTLILNKNNDFEVRVDQTVLVKGNMVTDMQPSVQPPSQIADPEDKKPDNWDDREYIVDPETKKPDDWDETAPREIEDVTAQKPDGWLDNEPPFIPDPQAEKPADWDDEMDGEYEPKLVENPKCAGTVGCGKWTKPKIPNPAYKGPWSAPRIKNPAYKGVWNARLIDNPHYFEANPFQQLKTVTTLGIELWTISSNIIFDNIIITEDDQLAADLAQATFTVKRQFEDALEAFETPAKGVWQWLVDATNERPYLWAVYVLCILIPVIALSAYFFGHKSTPTYDQYRNAPGVEEESQDDEVVEGNKAEESGHESKAATDAEEEKPSTSSEQPSPSSPSKPRRRAGKVRKVEE